MSAEQSLHEAQTQSLNSTYKETRDAKFSRMVARINDEGIFFKIPFFGFMKITYWRKI